MKNYRGYYIDGNIFTCKADIDQHIKAQNVRTFKMYMRMFNRYSDKGDLGMAMVASNKATDVAEYLVSYCGMTWAEIEELEKAA